MIIMWPVEDIGSHSVTPSTMPKRIALSMSKMYSIDELNRSIVSKDFYNLHIL